MKLQTIFCLGTLILSSFSFSNQKSIEECAKIEDPNLRLKCYDSFLLSSAPQEKKESSPSMEKAENYYKPPPNKIKIEPVKSAEPSQELKQAQIKLAAIPRGGVGKGADTPEADDVLVLTAAHNSAFVSNR